MELEMDPEFQLSLHSVRCHSSFASQRRHNVGLNNL
jgi:hypothetical protein